MSRWGDFESQTVERLKARLPSAVKTIDAASTEELAEDASKSFPAVYAIWDGADRTDPVGTMGSKIHPQVVARLKVICFASTGMQDAETRHDDGGLYDLLDWQRTALLGMVLKTPGGKYPLLWQNEEPLSLTRHGRLKAVAHYTAEQTLEATIG